MTRPHDINGNCHTLSLILTQEVSHLVINLLLKEIINIFREKFYIVASFVFVELVALQEVLGNSDRKTSKQDAKYD